ncbi:DUF3892 domain-containing protein [Pelagerythrobacter sp.]|uniref:DUF3892 domain-containing protein n=1 Tax=Pelagerythrobacter sp. TaxID=2800702 RepID=UPI0035AF32A5
MATFYATCFTPDNQDTDRRIQGLGGVGWWYSIDTIIAYIAAGDIFYTLNPAGQQQQIVVDTHPTSRRRYLRTIYDSYPHNNILNLPQCSR